MKVLKLLPNSLGSDALQLFFRKAKGIFHKPKCSLWFVHLFVIRLKGMYVRKCS